jgi:ring-1,2-phenylacetyl-CoA epoxidase subunit PaaD
MNISISNIYTWLEEVKDPEIPVLSLVDLGVIKEVIVVNDVVDLTITPTFVGCPALEMMKEEIVSKLKEHGLKEVNIKVSFKEPWSSDQISAKGREALKKFGLAPPPAVSLFEDLDILEHAACPRCGGTNTELRSTFGATLCRSIHYCNSCREAFEQFKPV